MLRFPITGVEKFDGTPFIPYLTKWAIMSVIVISSDKHPESVVLLCNESLKNLIYFWIQKLTVVLTSHLC